MTDPRYDGTIDWDAFWRDADEGDRDGATASAHHARDVIAAFLEETGAPDSFADVGCGPGLVAFDVAERYPDATVVGYDAAEPVIAENRERAREEGVDNVRFERAVLPEFDPETVIDPETECDRGAAFDVVFCYATLGYVAESERAVEALYDAVAPDGYLVCSYPSRFAQSHYASVAAAPAEHLADEPGFDPERYADRFELVIDGQSLLSYDRIHDALGTWPQSVWSVVEKPDVRWAWRHHPLVYVPK